MNHLIKRHNKRNRHSFWKMENLLIGRNRCLICLSKIRRLYRRRILSLCQKLNKIKSWHEIENDFQLMSI